MIGCRRPCRPPSREPRSRSPTSARTGSARSRRGGAVGETIATVQVNVARSAIIAASSGRRAATGGADVLLVQDPLGRVGHPHPVDPAPGHGLPGERRPARTPVRAGRSARAPTAAAPAARARRRHRRTRPRPRASAGAGRGEGRAVTVAAATGGDVVPSRSLKIERGATGRPSEAGASVADAVDVYFAAPASFRPVIIHLPALDPCPPCPSPRRAAA